MSDRRRALAAVACAVLGTALMVVIDSPYALVAGLMLLVAFIVLGASAIATPEYLAGDGGEDDDPA